MSLPLKRVCELLGSMAPLELAEPWDNVGLLLEPIATAEQEIDRVLMTIDLTHSVLDEALEYGAQLVVAYHPVWFRSLKRLTTANERQRLLLAILQQQIAVYSPHTALDAAPGGVNDWLAEALGKGKSTALVPSPLSKPEEALKVVVFVPRRHVDELRAALSEEAGAGVLGNYTQCSYVLDGCGTFVGGQASTPAVGRRGQLERAEEVRLEMVCSRRSLPRASQVIKAMHPYEEPAWDVYALEPKRDATTGMGRRVALDSPTGLDELVDRVKKHLGLSHVRVAAAPRHLRGERVRSAAVCAGSGGGVFEQAGSADLWLTGELGHHDVLARVERGESVILCDHTNTERGYLRRFAERLRHATSDMLGVSVARRDADPLSVR